MSTTMALDGLERLNRFSSMRPSGAILLENDMFDVKEYQKLYGKQYRQSSHGKEQRKKSNKKYHKSAKYIIYRKNYRKSIKSKLSDKLYRESAGYKESQKRWNQSAKKKAYWKLYWQRPEYKESRKQYRKSHKEEIRNSLRAWRQSPEGRLYKKVALANRRLLTKDLTIGIIQQVYENNIKKYGTLTCYLCLKPIEFGKDSLEHKMPLSRGGNNRKNNLDVACRWCNASKGSKTVEEFKKEKCYEKSC